METGKNAVGGAPGAPNGDGSSGDDNRGDDDNAGSPSPTRPTGRDEVRSAVMREARRLLSDRGPNVPLRDIADAAQVNLGLIHRHIGRKDALLTEVMQDAVRYGAARLEDLDDAGEAARGMLLGASSHPEISRLLAWLALDREAAFPPMLDPSQRPAAALRRMTSPPPAGDVELLLVFTAVYAWPVLRGALLDALDIPEADREGIDERLADLLARVITGDR
ncbi:TetR/AcrR family transcriptional regulator [Dietzia maris]|jgi:AcrR family transcriptional regulator|uniref:TetR/AcrR family transcriptional regulator n=1 Tax=Dietzia TaxID=37914 RepID=UPI0009EE2A5D|nr:MULTISPECIES: TetR/AcrR family transcriptional regulator [Dietzia]MCZ4539478.1 helix-turn-helix domain containing protein [Dietzia maris]MCZ4656058.1 helix-turn-helix domain containing protein [Dietzia kunjamensis]MDJ0422697.1 helix-turn-helix domain-containing protein [Dietzia kunjamensis]MDV3354548.1 helix-turn-helix domain-containing protein [Dietzia sp. IN118]